MLFNSTNLLGGFYLLAVSVEEIVGAPNKKKLNLSGAD